MVFLGDFARYRELHNQKSKKDFSRAEGYYHKAIAIMPQRGNPHNQLAVLATYADAECIAVSSRVVAIALNLMSCCRCIDTVGV